MQVAEFYQRFGADGDGYRQPAQDRCHGRVVCVDCPRDYLAPPLLALRLPVHIRLHRERFPTHAIRFWCWTCYEFHPEGDDPLTEEYAEVEIAIGICARDGNVWGVNADRQNCILCGRPPDRLVSLEMPGGEQPETGGADTPELPAPASITSFEAPCPVCAAGLIADITPDSFSLHPASGPPEAAPAGVAESAPEAPASALLSASSPEPVGADSHLSPAGDLPTVDDHTASRAEPPAGLLA